MLFKNRYHIYTAFLILITLTNCQLHESSNTHGIVFLDNRSNKLIINETNKNDVINLIGQPHSKSINNEDQWIYIERVLIKGDYHKLGRNVLKTNNVLILDFNKYGILKKKQLLKKDDIEKLTFAKNTTANKLTQLSFVEKLLSSLRQKMYSSSGR